MKRRSLLKALGVLPFAGPAVAKVLAAEVEAEPVRSEPERKVGDRYLLGGGAATFTNGYSYVYDGDTGKWVVSTTERIAVGTTKTAWENAPDNGEIWGAAKCRETLEAYWAKKPST